MSVIAIFTISSESFPLGKCIRNQLTAEIEIERIAPIRKETFPFIFVWDHTNFEKLEATAREIHEIELITELETFENGKLYKISWRDGHCPLISEIIDNDGTILSAKGDSKTWEFELRFPEHMNASQFFRDVSGEGNVNIKLKSLVKEVNFESTEGTSMLTRKQERALKTAVEMGYFSVPREAHLDDVAETLGISSSAASSLLRRGCSRVFEDQLTDGLQ